MSNPLDPQVQFVMQLLNKMTQEGAPNPSNIADMLLLEMNLQPIATRAGFYTYLLLSAHYLGSEIATDTLEALYENLRIIFGE